MSAVRVVLSAVTVASPLTALLYDDRYREARDRPLPLFRSFDARRIPFLIGQPLDAAGHAKQQSESSGGVGGVHSHAASYHPSHKVVWLKNTLPTLVDRTSLVFLADTDTMWFCSAADVGSKRAELLRERGLPDSTVVISSENGLWPPYQQYRGKTVGTLPRPGRQVVRGWNASYELGTASEPFRFLNAGATLGRPADVQAMLQCMAERYADFPAACPAGHNKSGDLVYYTNASGMEWVPPSPLKKHFHGMALKGPHWGWEQACFHMYYHEYINGELPPSCPPLLLDRSARLVLHLAGTKLPHLEYGLDGDDFVRARFNGTGQRPCLVHGNGATKGRMHDVWRRWTSHEEAKAKAHAGALR